jgi:acetylornithine/succinyldiaminopimelate/putrescine aminotransferase
MEVKVGIRDVPREVIVETTESAADVQKALEAALANDEVFVLTDERGRRVLIPTAGIAYVDLGSEHARPVGFGAVEDKR